MSLQSEGESLQEWLDRKYPYPKDLSEVMKYDEFDQMRSMVKFVREALLMLFVSTWDEYKKHPVQMVATYSNALSIELPVYRIAVPGIEIRLIYDAFGSVISICSDKPVPDNFFHLINRTNVVNRVLGLSADWVFGSYADNPAQFTVNIWSPYDVYTFLYLLSEGLQLRTDDAVTR